MFEMCVNSRCVGTHILMSIGFGHSRLAFVACDGEYYNTTIVIGESVNE